MSVTDPPFSIPVGLSQLESLPRRGYRKMKTLDVKCFSVFFRCNQIATPIGKA